MFFVISYSIVLYWWICISGCTNYIENGFYDVGQLRPETKFLTLEEYAKQDQNEKRPIILINAKPE